MKPFIPLLFLLIVSITYAHQPYLITAGSGTETDPFIIDNPSVSKVMYGELNGAPVYYKTTSDRPFRLYIQILAPDTPGYDGNAHKISVYVSTEKRMGVFFIDENNYFWSTYFEEFGNDYYLTGPEFSKDVANGTYIIRLYNRENSGKYALAIGEEERFGPLEMINALVQVPLIKQRIFGHQIAERFLELLGLLIVVSAIVSLYVAARLSRTREMGHVFVRFYESLKYVVWAGLIILTASWYYVFSQNPSNIFGIIKTVILAAFILKWALFFFLNNWKLDKVREKNAALRPNFLRSITIQLAVSLFLLLLLATASVIA